MLIRLRLSGRYTFVSALHCAKASMPTSYTLSGTCIVFSSVHPWNIPSEIDRMVSHQETERSLVKSAKA